MQTKICSLQDWINVEEFLIKGLLLSKSSIKKSDLKKTFLSRSIKNKEEISLPINLLNKGLINPNYSGVDIDILFEDEELWVVNKPFALHGHPLTYCESDNVLTFLRNISSTVFLGERSDNMERGLFYRLDQVTSGLLVIAKDKEFAMKLRDSFKVVAKRKAYLAIVQGEFNLDGTHQHFFSAQGSKGHKNLAQDSGEGDAGILSVKCLKFNKEENLSLIYVELETGLRHQIRSQMSALGFPLLGDELYGGNKEKRVYLHAYKYQFEINSVVKEWTCDQAPLFAGFFNVDSCLKMLSE